MPRTIRLSDDGAQLLVVSEYNDAIRIAIRAFRGARWDRDERCWRVPVEHRGPLLAELAPFAFDLDARLAATTLPLAAPSAASATPAATTAAAAITVLRSGPLSSPAEVDDTLSVSALNVQVRDALGARFPRPVWVRGELSSFDKGAGRRHWYFDLVEKEAHGDHVANRLAAVIFDRDRERILTRVREAALALRDGLEVRVRGRVEYYGRSGRLQLVIDELDPAFSLGRLALERQRILGALASEGLLGRNARLPMPALPLRVGLVTARDSDALHDFVETLSASPYAFEVLHVAASVQGPQVEAQVLAGLDRLRRLRPAPDVVAIVRGGGSRSDLAWFDNYALAKAVAELPLKVLIGIGHERDQSVLDEVAQSLKTPTAAAELLVARVQHAEAALVQLGARLADTTRRRLGAESVRQAQREARLRAAAATSSARASSHLERHLAQRVRAASLAHLGREQGRLARLDARLAPEALIERLRPTRQRFDAAERRLRLGAKNRLGQLRAELQTLAARVDAVDPKRILARGFAVLYGPDGAPVRDGAHLRPGDAVRVELLRGSVAAEVVSVDLPAEGAPADPGATPPDAAAPTPPPDPSGDA
jgi:exodeoxyribonuclease VII large subunit